jgi:hypothetical protein
MAERGKLVSDVIQGLRALQDCKFTSLEDCRRNSFEAEKLLVRLYKAGIAGVKYTKEEGDIIGPLVPGALDVLGLRVDDILICFPPTSVTSSKVERSGLQFLLDDCKDFPASSSNKTKTLEEPIQTFLDRQDIEGWDKRLKDAEYDPVTEAAWPADSIKEVVDKIPSTHHWWF